MAEEQKSPNGFSKGLQTEFDQVWEAIKSDRVRYEHYRETQAKRDTDQTNKLIQLETTAGKFDFKTLIPVIATIVSGFSLLVLIGLAFSKLTNEPIKEQLRSLKHSDELQWVEIRTTEKETAFTRGVRHEQEKVK